MGVAHVTKGFREGDRSRVPLRDARRFPSTRWYSIPGAKRTPLGFGICPAFKGHFLSRRAKPQRYDSQLLHRCTGGTAEVVRAAAAAGASAAEKVIPAASELERALAEAAARAKHKRKRSKEKKRSKRKVRFTLRGLDRGSGRDVAS
jgi:hypothetical protein